jgi:hypothetical protein
VVQLQEVLLLIVDDPEIRDLTPEILARRLREVGGNLPEQVQAAARQPLAGFPPESRGSLAGQVLGLRTLSIQ